MFSELKFVIGCRKELRDDADSGSLMDYRLDVSDKEFLWYLESRMYKSPYGMQSRKKNAEISLFDVLKDLNESFPESCMIFSGEIISKKF